MENILKVLDEALASMRCDKKIAEYNLEEAKKEIKNLQAEIEKLKKFICEKEEKNDA